MMRSINILFSIILTITIVACSDAAKKNDSNKTAKIDKKLIDIELLAIGESMAEIAFEPSTITIDANSRIRLTLRNESTSAGMLHNFVLVEIGSGDDIAKAGIKAGKKNQFVPNDKRVIAFTDMIDLGETTIIEFDAPAKGSYHYICTFPGHYPNMVGRLIVK